MSDDAGRMDHPHYRYSALPSRPKLVWPGGARVAVCVYLYFEYAEVVPAENAIRDPRFNARSAPDIRMHSWHDYANRIGIFRILDLLDRVGFTATVAANAEAAERTPYLVEAFRRRGYEFAAHGPSVGRMVSSRMTEAAERQLIGESVARLQAATGTRPTGWFAQDFGESAATPSLLAEAGLDYVADWPNDDQPYRMDGGLVALPNQAAWDDLQLVWDRRLQMPRYRSIVTEAFTRLHAEAGESGRFFSLPIHPWLLGAPHRIAYLEAVVEAIAGTSGIWQATAGAVARFVRGA